MMSKYKNHKVTHDGMTFDSKKECERYKVLKTWQKQDRGRMSDIIDGRYSQSKPMLITTNLPKEQLIERLGSRAWDRLQQCIVVAGCNWQSYRQLNNRYLEI